MAGMMASAGKGVEIEDSLIISKARLAWLRHNDCRGFRAFDNLSASCVLRFDISHDAVNKRWLKGPQW